MTERCGSRFAIRIPSAPSDEWDSATCIQYHDRLPAPVGTIHDDGEGTRWVEINGFFERDTESVREIIQNTIDNSEVIDGVTQRASNALTDELCEALGLPKRNRS